MRAEIIIELLNLGGHDDNLGHPCSYATALWTTCPLFRGCAFCRRPLLETTGVAWQSQVENEH